MRKADLDFDFFESDGFRIRRRDLDRPRVAGDLLDGTHEHVGCDGDAEEAPYHCDEVESGSDDRRPRVLAEQRQDESLVRARVVVQVRQRHVRLIHTGDHDVYSPVNDLHTPSHRGNGNWTTRGCRR